MEIHLGCLFALMILNPICEACPMPKIKNGTVRMQRGGRMAYFFCAPGFEIHGAMNVACQTGRWKQDLPICMKPGCEAPTKRPNAFVMMSERKQKVMLFCVDGYSIAGSTMAFCDGKQWDRALGECRLDVGHTKSCDFETSDMCEWTQDAENSFPWVRRSGWTSFEKLEFGPKHDHTTGKPLAGHYMVAEATNSRSTQKSRLWSPMYSKNDSVDACFRFYYHMYGSKIGQLRVLLKPSNVTIDDLTEQPKNILFEKQNSQGNQWNKAIFRLNRIDKDFQIIFEATGNNGLISDIAIDDVALMNNGDCIKALPKENVTEETGGIFDVQSCANRCNETMSVRANSSTIITDGGALIEKCDCHAECMDIGTCCTDFASRCPDNDATDSDVSTTPIDEAVMEKSTNVRKAVTPKVAVAGSTTDKIPIPTNKSSTLKTTPTMATVSTSTPASMSKGTSTSLSTPKSTSTQRTTVRTTQTTVTITTSSAKPTPSPTVKTSATKASTPAKTTPSTPRSTARTPMTTLSTTSMKPVITTARVPSTSTVRSTTPTKRTTERTRVTTQTTSTPTKPPATKPSRTTMKTTKATKLFTQQKPNSTTSRPTKPRIVTVSARTTTQLVQLVATTTTKVTMMTKIAATSRVFTTPTTDATLNAMLKPTDTGKVASLSTIIIICILLTAALIGWRYFNANKWNRFNSQQIEFKSNYPSGGAEESLIRSHSFIIDDAFNENLIGESDVDEAVASGNDVGTGVKVKKTSVSGKSDSKSARKTKRSVNRLGKDRDLYSERRCLTEDDEQFDFTPQTTL